MAIVAEDDPSMKPEAEAAIPFGWETRPGVSKFKEHQSHDSLEPPRSSSASSFAAPSKELQTQWVKSMSFNRKNRLSSQLTRLGLALRQNVCNPKSWLRWKWGKESKEKRVAKPPKLKLKLELHPECIMDYASYLENLARLSTMPSAQRVSTSRRLSTSHQRSSSQSTFSKDDEEMAPTAPPPLLFHDLFRHLKPTIIGTEGKGREKKEINISVYMINSNT